jgi:hypothetical protein
MDLVSVTKGREEVLYGTRQGDLLFEMGARRSKLSQEE